MKKRIAESTEIADSTDELAVLAVNKAFYSAFAAADFDAMEALWARLPGVVCIHPGWDALRGRERVMASWRAILAGDGAKVEASGATAHVVGDAAFVICHETIEGTRLVATNSFVRDGAGWKMVHHQAAPIARAALDDEEDDGDDELPPPSGVLN